MPLSSEAFSSNVMAPYLLAPYICLAQARMVEVLPGGRREGGEGGREGREGGRATMRVAVPGEETR
jgi:hypothetical protein